MNTQTKESQSQMTPDGALKILVDGNARFVNDQLATKELLSQVNITSSGQFPFATVLSCIDSRVPAEMVFDQGIGDIFSIRIAGNILNEDILGSMEFACNVAGSKLIVVLGHTSCGAVKGAIGNVELGNLTGLLKKIEPAIKKVKEEANFATDDAAFVDAVVNHNVDNVADEILLKSEILNEMVNEGNIKIVKAVYSVETGVVTFY